MSDFELSAKAHWEYVRDLLKLHGEREDIIEKIGFHYISAMIHGFKHGCENKK